jgi:predicted nuclease with RNAse H fold
MNIISIDLPWEKKTKGRRALAMADLEGNVRIAPASDDNEMLELALESVEPGSIILLDIPIDGCDNLDSKHFRSVDKAIAKQALPVLPASKAGSRRKRLKTLLERDKKGLKVYEIYPYATYKFLACLKEKGLLPALRTGKLDALLDSGFRTYWPPKYKREKKRD